MLQEIKNLLVHAGLPSAVCMIGKPINRGCLRFGTSTGDGLNPVRPRRFAVCGLGLFKPRNRDRPLAPIHHVFIPTSSRPFYSVRRAGHYYSSGRPHPSGVRREWRNHTDIFDASWQTQFWRTDAGQLQFSRSVCLSVVHGHRRPDCLLVGCLCH